MINSTIDRITETTTQSLFKTFTVGILGVRQPAPLFRGFIVPRNSGGCTAAKALNLPEIMLPANAPPEFADRSILWNSVERIEKARDSQLAREIEAALPRELSIEQQLALVRSYVKDNFVDKGMCADFAIHDKGTGNPHVHIMLTLRPLKENGQWGAKCRKAYDLDENGQRIPDGKACSWNRFCPARRYAGRPAGRLP